MRTSDHFLEIERGRYKRVKRPDRLCTMCTNNVLEDEIHYFFHCPKYSDIRKNLENNIKNSYENDINKYINIMSSWSHLQFVVPFIKKSLILRKVDLKIA